MPPLPNKKITDQLNASQRLDAPLIRQPGFVKSKLALIVVIAVWLGLIGLIFANQQRISDWWRLRGYEPPANIQRLAGQDTMTGYTRHLFYLNKPQLLSTVGSFRQHCPENKDTIVLGCYHPVENGIYVYTVKDPSLKGVTQVTAAHEVLHAIYGRLSDKDRTSVDKLLNDYYKNGLTDQRVKDEIRIYQQTEPTAVLDEMHSTFGTEIANLPAPLENYYKQYFSNRAAIVAYEQQYDAAFSSRQSAIASDDRRLASMKTRIDSQQSALAAQLNQLNAQRGRLDGLKAAGQLDSYNAEVPAYNAQISAYNAGVSSLKTTIDSYNQLVVARNLLAGQLGVLDKAIDTRLTQQAVQ